MSKAKINLIIDSLLFLSIAAILVTLVILLTVLPALVKPEVQEGGEGMRRGRGRAILHNARALGIDLARVEAIVLSIERLMPAHCTGMEAMAELWAAFPGKCFPTAAGMATEFGVPQSGKTNPRGRE